MTGLNKFLYQVDLANPKAIRSVAAKVRSEHGDPTIRRTFDVNILAHFLLVQEFLPDMVSRNHGHVPLDIAVCEGFALLIPGAYQKSAFREENSCAGMSQDVYRVLT
ncbi:short-chain dehydrogenase reductase [Penicillium pulvis]|uniref:short-chain dehydrogenase reductase n=1 Tax=Penicillium pulvis TaxID=1562058 RepID=UPI0025487F28|nr:short-chain dehydrogenase reductase [Penicillium pulvis]KAJ5805958.1 short-chain dehydrogenase reductase [Penicillium pulvis]